MLSSTATKLDGKEILRHTLETMGSLLTFEPLFKLVLKQGVGVVAVHRPHRGGREKTR